MKVAFLHPDLGLGGAERLVVDAATGLSSLGHVVDMYTSHYEARRSFVETRSGAFRVHAIGDWLPRTIFGSFHIVTALMRNAYLAVAVAVTAKDADVFVCDQVSICIPILRILRPKCGILFYCHFPDMLLAQRKSLLKKVYRWPFDVLEEACTGLADTVVVNSKFTRDVFARTFTSVKREPAVLYPCINIAPEMAAATGQPQTVPRLFLSINRFERKKGIDVAIHAFAHVLRQLPGGLAGAAAAGFHLIIAGGYDERVRENIEHYMELVQTAQEEGLIGDSIQSDAASVSRILTRWPVDAQQRQEAQTFERVTVGRHITFVRSFSDEQKTALLDMAMAVVYTPQNEHFGIVPLECMAARRPVLACNSGGPLESIETGRTGILCDPTPAAFAKAMLEIANDPKKASTMGEQGLRHVAGKFSRQVFAAQLELECSRLAGGGKSGGEQQRPERLLAQWIRLLTLVLMLLAAVCALLLAGKVAFAYLSSGQLPERPMIGLGVSPYWYWLQAFARKAAVTGNGIAEQSDTWQSRLTMWLGVNDE